MKKAFSLIEIVLTIVIVAIAMVALPTIVTQTQQSNETAIKQQLILDARSLMGRIISSPWDSEHYTQRHARLLTAHPSCSNNLRTILTTSTASATCRISSFVPIYNVTPDSRPGANLANQDVYSIYMKDGIDIPFKTVTGVSYGLNPGGNEIDDYAGNFQTTVVPDNGDFIIQANFNTVVNTNNDVKSIQVSVSDVNSPFVVTLRYDAMNIGDSIPVRKNWR